MSPSGERKPNKTNLTAKMQRLGEDSGLEPLTLPTHRTELPTVLISLLRLVILDKYKYFICNKLIINGII